MTQQELWLFSFVCLPDRVKEARGALAKFPRVELKPEDVAVFRALASLTGGEPVVQSGSQIEGACDEADIQSIVDVLSNLRIAAYSRETMILAWRLSELSKLK